MKSTPERLARPYLLCPDDFSASRTWGGENSSRKVPNVAAVNRGKSRAHCKTDRRDASRLSELLWINRHRPPTGQAVHCLQRIVPPTAKDRENRPLTSLRKRLTDQRTRLINRIKRVVNEYNLAEECPTKKIQTKQARGPG